MEYLGENLDNLLSIILDSNWHSYDYLRNKISIPYDHFNIIIYFLAGQGFITIINDMIKITSRGSKTLELPV
jgi:hypothetical protein